MNTDFMADLSYECPVPGPAGALCTKCRTIKPAAEFKRRLSRAQSLARGYQASVRLEIDSSLCKACQPRRKPLAERSINEVRNLVATGEMREAVALDYIKKRKEQLSFDRRNAMEKYWLSVRVKPLRQHLTHEIARCMTARAYHAKRNAAPMLAFYDTYIPFLRGIRFLIDSKTKTRPKHKKDELPRVTHWLELADAERKIRVLEAWEAVPLDQRTAARRMPEILTPTQVFKEDPARLPPAILPSERRRREAEEAWRTGAAFDALAQEEEEEEEETRREHSSPSSAPPDWLDELMNP